MGHDYGAWWTGSTLTIEETRRLLPGQNATTVPVAAGVVSGLAWVLTHTKQGVCWPEQLPPEPTLNAALPFLGAFQSFPVSWDPIQAQLRSVHLDYRQSEAALKARDPWQFSSFAFND